MPLTRLALRNPVAVTLLFAGLVLLGLGLAPFRMGRGLLPPLAFPVTSVSATYPGAAPADVERLVIEPIEEQLAQAPDVERVFAVAQDGAALVTVRFHFGSGLDADLSATQRAVDAARAKLPADLVPPAVAKSDPGQAPVAEIALTSAVLDDIELAHLAERDIAPALRRTSAVGRVAISGARTPRFVIGPRSAALTALHVTVLDIARAATAAADVFPGGRLGTAPLERTLGIRADAPSRESLARLPLVVPGGTTLRIGDVAEVRYTDDEPRSLVRVDDEPAVLLSVSPAAGADAPRAIAAMRATLARLATLFPLVRFGVLRTDAPAVEASVAGVAQTLGEGVVLTVLVVLLFLHAWRNAAVAAIAIPTSIAATFAAMWALGFTLNLLSLMGLSLTIGILVDDSIVILEAIAARVAAGLYGDEAALAGRRDLGGAAFAITFVDVAVFAPIGLTSGLVGEFMREFGFVVVIATAFSLLVSFTLTPLLSARWAQRVARRATERRLPQTLRAGPLAAVLALLRGLREGFERAERNAADAYATRWLPALASKRRWVFAAATLVCGLSFVPLFAGAIPSEFSPNFGRGAATFDIELPAGTPLARTDAVLRKLSGEFAAREGVRHVVSNAGREFNGAADVSGSNLGQIEVVLDDPAGTGDDITRFAQTMPPPAWGVRIAGSGRGMGGASAISYTLAGDAAKLDRAAARVAALLRANPYASDVRVSNGGVVSRLELRVDPGRAQIAGLSSDDVAQTARIASAGSLVTRVRTNSGFSEVVVRSDAAAGGDMTKLRGFGVRAAGGTLVPLGMVVRFEASREPEIVERENGARVVTVSANALPGEPIGRVSEPLRRALRAPGALPEGTYVEPRGDVEQFLDAAGKIGIAFLFALLAVYAIVAVLYRSYGVPLIVMSTVPLAAVGAFGALAAANALHAVFPGAALFAGQTLNLYSLLGIVMLIGLVAKNGILLVDFAEREVRSGRAAFEAVCLAAHRRFRPIVMTTFAMIAGMLPLALGHTAGAEYRKALGTVVIGGLSSSLLLTLFVLPLAYAAFRGERSAGRNVRA